MAFLVAAATGWRGGRRRLALLGVALGWAVVPALAAPENAVSEAELRAAFVFNFIKFTDWPDSRFHAPDAAIVVGVASDNPIADTLSRAIAGKHAGTHPIEIRRLGRDLDWTGCHALLLSDDLVPSAADVAAALGRSGLLLVGDADRWPQLRATIRFAREGTRLRFEVDLELAARANLRISSKLLALSRLVRGRAPAEER